MPQNKFAVTVAKYGLNMGAFSDITGISKVTWNKFFSGEKKSLSRETVKRCDRILHALDFIKYEVNSNTFGKNGVPIFKHYSKASLSAYIGLTSIHFDNLSWGELFFISRSMLRDAYSYDVFRTQLDFYHFVDKYRMETKKRHT